MDAQVDFLIITPLEEELQALLSKLTNYRKTLPLDSDINNYYQHSLVTTFGDGSMGNYQAIIMTLLGMGRVQATNATSNAIHRWNPRYVLLVGIAGGVASRDVHLGDVLLPDQVVDYELKKQVDSGTQTRYEVYRTDPRLLSASRSIRGETWLPLITENRPKSGLPRHHYGPIATGDSVIASTAKLQNIVISWPKLLGVEMEAGGVALATFQAPSKPGFFMIRGVSDLADSAKGSLAVEKWRKYASDVAAAYCLGFLSSGPVSVAEQPTPQSGLVVPGSIASKNNVVNSSSIRYGPKVSQLPDILTPGLSQNFLLQSLIPHVGVSTAQDLVLLSNLTIEAVENGDFQAFVTLGTRIQEEGGTHPEIQAVGSYLIGEGYRLLRDLERNPLQQTFFLQEAVKYYTLSSEIEPNNPRVFRGLARVYEVQQRFDEAINLLERAKGLALAQLSLPAPIELQLGLVHEILRITRHYIDCIINIRATNPQSKWHLEHKKLQLEGYIYESTNFHYEKLPMFEEQERWLQFEWFAGLILLGKAWGSLGNHSAMRQNLTLAILSRRRMLENSRPLTQIEIANLEWWVRIVTSQPNAVKGLTKEFEELQEALSNKETTNILQKIDALVFRSLLP